MSRRLFVGLILLFAAACSLWGLLPRWRVERVNDSVAIITDFRSILPLAESAGLSVDEALSRLKECGLRGLMVSELTGDDLMNGVGPASLVSLGGGVQEREGVLVSVLPGAPRFDLLSKWIRLRLLASGDATEGPVVLPMPINMMKTVGVVPDIAGLEAAVKAGLPIFYRPAPTPGWLTQNAADALRAVADAYPLAAFAPSGEVIPGYPDVSPLAAVSRERRLPVAAVEFNRQLGATAFNNMASPLLLPLHSVTNEEMMARNITRQGLVERLLRAAAERSVRLLVTRPAPQNMGSSTFDAFVAEVQDLANGLEGLGLRLGWPQAHFPSNAWRSGFLPACALAAVLLLTIWCFAARLGLLSGLPALSLETVRPAAAAAFAALAVLSAFLMVRSAAAARLIGAFAAPLIATEASLAAMDFSRKRQTLFLALEGFLLAVAGGLTLAAFFSVPSYMLRIQTFSGVKLTLLLPPLLVLLHDLKNRIHPESLTDILSRPPLWGELMLCAVLLAGLGLMLFRSGNVQFIPGFEARVRETLERLLVARPRSKEVFLGYPSLLILAFLVKQGLWARYREVLRVGVALGFSSVVNSFCHFHTPILFILLREFNGFWTGLILGAILVAALRWALLPALRWVRPLME